jgi:hypothetical protein
MALKSRRGLKVASVRPEQARFRAHWHPLHGTEWPLSKHHILFFLNSDISHVVGQARKKVVLSRS